jgi:hypothetical protein
MDNDEIKKEILSIIFAILILAISFYYKSSYSFGIIIIFVTVTLLVNIIIKKISAYVYEADIRHSIWSIKHLGFERMFELKNPLSMIWFPLFTSFISMGFFQWMPILTFNFEPKPERSSKRHGIYRYTEVSEYDLSFIVFFGILANLVFSIFAYLLGFEFLAKLNIYYAFWSIIPISKLDGSKLFFGNKKLWIVTSTIVAFFLIGSFSF